MSCSPSQTTGHRFGTPFDSGTIAMSLLPHARTQVSELGPRIAPAVYLVGCLGFVLTAVGVAVRAPWWSVVLVAIASITLFRLAGRVAQDARDLWDLNALPAAIDRGELASLPPPVRRYLSQAIRRSRAPRTVTLSHGGTFRMKRGQGWLPIRGRQYFATDPPGFVWWGRVRLAPGVWIDAHDQSIRGAGAMRVRVESTIPIVDRSGDELDLGALIRLLAEMVWFPTSFVDHRHVAWWAIDDKRAGVILRVGGREVAAVFHFGADGLPARIFAERFRDVDGKPEAAVWSVDLGDYREVDGLIVPHDARATWHLDEGEHTYAHFVVERIEYDKEVQS
jgi:hypothetical protein